MQTKIHFTEKTHLIDEIRWYKRIYIGISDKEAVYQINKDFILDKKTDFSDIEILNLKRLISEYILENNISAFDYTNHYRIEDIFNKFKENYLNPTRQKKRK